VHFQISAIFFRFAGGGRHADNGHIQGGSNMTGTNCDLFTHNQSRSYLNHLVYIWILLTVVFKEAGVAQSV
jgi:hypothetical protein